MLSGYLQPADGASLVLSGVTVLRKLVGRVDA